MHKYNVYLLLRTKLNLTIKIVDVFASTPESVESTQQHFKSLKGTHKYHLGSIVTALWHTTLDSSNKS